MTDDASRSQSTTREPGGDDLRLQVAAGLVHERLFRGARTAPRIGGYALLEPLGEGASGVVYSAHDDRLARKVAIKLAHRHNTDGRRMIREARALARLAHPNVVPVFEVGEFAGQLYIVMEFVRGPTLRAWLAAKPRAWSEILALFVQAGRGLTAAHAAGIVHRDFKPDNVIVGEDGRPRVLDFGLAREEPEPGVDAVIDDSMLTATGALMGTPAYMSPEQFRGGPVDARTDQFNFCAALWEALYGRRAHEATDLARRREAVLAGRIGDPPDASRVPSRVQQALRRGLAVDPADRFPDMAALLAALTPGRTSRRWLAGLVAIVGAVGIGAAWIGRTDLVDRCTASAEAGAAAMWSDERRAGVREGLLATGAPFAAVTAAHVERRVDRLLADWQAEQRDNCRSTLADARQSTALFDRRALCLDDVLRGVAAQLDAFMPADAAVVARAAAAVDRLPEPGRCSAAALADATEAPSEPATATAVAQVRDRLARIAAALRAGRAATITDAAAAAVTDAAATGHAPIHAEALLLLGEIQLELDRYTAAEQTLFDALEQARAGRDRAVAFAAMSGLVHAHHLLAHAPEALRWARPTVFSVWATAECMGPYACSRSTSARWPRARTVAASPRRSATIACSLSTSATSGCSGPSSAVASASSATSRASASSRRPRLRSERACITPVSRVDRSVAARCSSASVSS